MTYLWQFTFTESSSLENKLLVWFNESSTFLQYLLIYNPAKHVLFAMTLYLHRFVGSWWPEDKSPHQYFKCMWPWPLDPKIDRVHFQFMGSLCVKFHDDRLRGIAIMQHKTFSDINALWHWPLNLKINRAHPQLMDSLCLKFHDDRYKSCKGRAILPHKLFSVINALWPWPFGPKIKRTQSWLMGSLCVKFLDNRCKENVVMRWKHFT